MVKPDLREKLFTSGSSARICYWAHGAAERPYLASFAGELESPLLQGKNTKVVAYLEDVNMTVRGSRMISSEVFKGVNPILAYLRVIEGPRGWKYDEMVDWHKEDKPDLFAKLDTIDALARKYPKRVGLIFEEALDTHAKVQRVEAQSAMSLAALNGEMEQGADAFKQYAGALAAEINIRNAAIESRVTEVVAGRNNTTVVMLMGAAHEGLSERLTSAGVRTSATYIDQLRGMEYVWPLEVEIVRALSQDPNAQISDLAYVQGWISKLLDLAFDGVEVQVSARAKREIVGDYFPTMDKILAFGETIKQNGAIESIRNLAVPYK